MSDLRNSFSVATDDGTRGLVNEEMVANGMGDLRRGWNAGRIGNEANYLAAQELGLRRDGRHAEADAVRAQIDQLNQRQAFYAPAVGRVEDIGGIGDGVDWLAGQVGQGAASMADPMAVGTAIGAAGRLAGLSKNPYAQMFSKAAPYLGALGAYGVGQRQMTGEMGNAMVADPQVMANTTPQQRWLDANAYGAGAGMLDTFLPGHLAGKVAGKGIVKALAKGGTRAAGMEMLGEGATEAAQEYGKQQVLGQLNPNRDTSGDASDLLNSFAGGMAGSLGPVAVGEGAHAAHNRIAKTADALGKKAGDVTDLVTGAATSAKEKGSGWLNTAKSLFGKGTQDLQEGAPGGQDGAPGRFKLSDEELATLDPEKVGIGPDHPEYADRLFKRADFIQQKLGEMAGENPEAAALYERMTANPQDFDGRFAAADQAANMFDAMHNRDGEGAKGDGLKEAGKAVGKAVGRGAAAVVKGALSTAATVGKAAWDGATSKKNAQSREGVNGHDDYTLGDWRRIQAERDIAKKYIDDAGPIARDAQRAARADLAARQAAEFIRTKYHGREGLARMASHVTFELLDASYGMRKTAVGRNAPAARNARLNRIAGTMQRIYGTEDAMKMADSIASIVGGQDVNNNTKYLKQAVEYVKSEIQHLSTSAGKRQAMQERHELAETLLSMVPPERESKMLDAGINIRQTDRNKFLELLEGFADGTSAPGMRKQLNDVFGAATVNKMLAHLNDADIAKGKDERTAKESAAFAESAHEQEIMGDGLDVNDDGEITDYEKRQGDKQVSKGGAPKLYGFKNTQTLRNSKDWSNPFSGARVSKSAMRAWYASVEESKALGVEPPEDPRIAAATQRPSLFGEKDTLSDGRNAIQARIDHMTQKLGDKASSWSVSAKRASKVLDEMGASDTSRVAMYRDYLLKALRAQKGTPEQKAKWKNEVGVLNRVLADMASGHHIDPDANAADHSTEDDETTSGIHSLRKKRTTAQADAARSATDPEAKKFSAEAYARTRASRRTATASSPQERRAALSRTNNFLENRYIVVAEDMTNRAPEDISTTEVESMSRTGAAAMDNARKITSMVESRIKQAGLTGAEANQMRKGAQREYNEVVDAYNILEFAPSEGDKPIYIKAGDLVYWARTQRNKSETVTKEAAPKFDRRNLDHEYLNDLMTGISTILASGTVAQQLPVKRNKFGKPEAFETPQQGKDGRKPRVVDSVPDSLRLVTMTAGQMRWKPETPDTRGPEWDGPPDPTAGGDARTDEDYQEAVAMDQARDEDPSVVDPLEDSGEIRTLDPQDYAALTPDERKQLNEFARLYDKVDEDQKPKVAQRQHAFVESLGLRKDGARYSTALSYTSSDRQRGMTEHAEETNAGRGVKPGKSYAGETRHAVHKEDPKLADQIPRDRRMRNADGTKRKRFVEDPKGPWDETVGARGSFHEMTDDEISPLDFFPDQEPGATPDEYADAQFRNRIEGYDASTTVSAEFKLSAASKAKERGLAIRAKLIPGINEGGDELTAKQLEGINEIAARIRSAYRPERREKGDDGLVGGWHYLYPVAYALNTDSLRKMAGGKDPAGLMPTLKFLRDQFKRALLDSAATPSQKAAVLRAASPAEWANKITEDNVIQLLERDAPARDEGLLSSAEPRTTGPSRQYDVGRKRIDPNDSPRRGSQPGFFGPEQPAPDFLPSSTYRSKQTPEVQREMSVTKREATAPSDRAYSPQVKQREAERAANDRAARLDKMIVDEDYSKLTTKDRVDRFLRAAKDRYAELRRMEEETGLSPEQKKAYDALWGMFNPRSTTDLASFYDGVPGTDGIDDDQVRAMLNEAAPEVAAQAPKSQSVPAGARKLNAQTRMSREDVEEQVMAALEIHGERFADGLPSAQHDEFMSLLDKAMSASRDELTGELSTGPVDLDAAKQLAEKYDVPTLRHWVNQLGDAVRNDQVFPNDGPNRVASDEDMAKAKEYLAKVAPQIKVHFENITGYSGEFIEAENVIKISTTAAAGTMETAYHEALHAFFAKFVKSNPKVLAAMRTLAENEKLLARVHALLKGFPAAQRQLADGEERLAYIFQFWAAGKLDLPVGRPTTIMQKLRKFFRRVAGMITNEERAVDLMHAFHEGKLSEPSAAGRVIADIMNQGTMTPKQLRKIDSWTQRAMGMVAASEEILAKSESATARELAKDFFTNPGDEDSAGHQEGYLNATRTVAMKYTNRFASIVRGLTDRDMSDVVNHMMNKEVSDDAEIAYAPVREAVKSLRALLREVYEHGKEAGVEMGEFKGSYFPRVWSVTKLVEKRDDFIKMLVDNYPDRLDALVSEAAKRDKTSVSSREAAATEIWQFLANVTAQNGRNDVMRQDGVLAPFFANGENRHFAWIETRHSGEFQHKNLTSIVTGYIHQGVKAAEYTRRFGREGKILEEKFRAVRAELHEVAAAKLNAQEFDSKEQANKWVNARMKNIKRACGAMEGTLGKDISPTLRKFNSWMMVYQNLRLLPLTLFASVVDPLGMVARGATMKEAYETFLRGMKEVFNNWADMIRENPKERQDDKWTLLAEHIGALDSIMLSHHVSEEYSSSYLSPGAKKINDMLFKINGMESWNRGVRSGAVRSAVKFIERHSKLPEVHSVRWLKELGLTPGHIALDADGELILDANELAAAKGITLPEAKRRVEGLHDAINRWVQGAILTPNAAQRPAWSSDPHYSVFFHLKQFSYSFHQTILKRAVKEMNHGNLAPIGAFAGYIPVMIASDIVKGLIVGGGELPAYMKGYDLGDWVKHGVERSGTLGIAGIGVDASHDIFSLAGPGAEQLTDALIDPIGDTTIRALPLNPLYAQLLK